MQANVNKKRRRKYVYAAIAGLAVFAAASVAAAYFAFLSLRSLLIITASLALLALIFSYGAFALWLDHRTKPPYRGPVRWMLEDLVVPPTLAIAVVVGLLAASVVQAGMRVEPTVTLGTAGLIWGQSGPIYAYAMGDSYAAGEGQVPFLPGTDDSGNRCHRSANAYSQLLSFNNAEHQPLIPNWTFMACSGALSEQLTSAAQNPATGVRNAPIQDALLTNRVNLVLVTIGANDFHWSEVLTQCSLNAQCLDQAPPLGHLDPGTEAGTPSAPTLRQWLPAMVKVMQDRLTGVFMAIREKAGTQARILVIGYPDILPTGEGDTSELICRPLLRSLTPAFRQTVADTERDFNRATYEAALAARVEFVDPNFIWQGHEVCGGEGGWLNAPYVDLVHGRVGPGTFHPTTVGQAELAGVVACYFQVHPTPPGTVDPEGSSGVRGGEPGADVPYVGGAGHSVPCDSASPQQAKGG
jgi:hypothetical protein